MKKTSIVSRLRSSRMAMFAATVAAASVASTLHATPYASEVTNNAGTVQFYLNESNATVVVTYEDGTTNANFNGQTTGTNVLAGPQSFALGGHSSYAITVTKLGSGSPSLIKQLSISGNPRGVDVNKNPASPYFGRVYEVNGGTGVYLLHPDLTYTFTNVARAAGVTTFTTANTSPTTGVSPYRLSVAADDSVIVGDGSVADSAVFRMDPNFTTNQLLLGPVGDTAALAAGVHGTIMSRPLLLGSTNAGNAVLMQIDGELSPYNAIQVYDIGAGPLPWETPPTYTGATVGVGVDSVGLGANEYPGLTRGPNGYLYCSTYRNNLSNPLIQVYDSTGVTNLWNSWEPDGTTYPGGTPTADYFLTAIQGITQGVVDSAISGDGKYLVAVNLDNGVLVCSVTNGIPNAASIFTVPNPSGTSGNARGIAWDAALNYYLSSSGLGAIQEWSLGVTATAVTKGDATGQTNFSLTLPSTQVSVVAVTNQASQSGPTPGVFTITRSSTISSDTNAPLTVYYKLTGTATNGSYTISGGTITNVTFAAGQDSTNIVITPVADNLPRPTTTVTLTLVGSGSYALTPPLADTIAIQNTGPEEIFISSVVAPSMYKGLTNDFGSFVLTRYGDTNDSGNTITVSSFSYGGTATAAEYVPAQPITFAPGVVSVTNTISPLIDTTNYVGNKTVTVSLGAGSGYTVYSNNTVTLTIIDNANLPATVLWADPLTDPNDATNWAVTSANNNMASVAPDNTIEFGYDLSANNSESFNNGLIPLPPNGATNVLRVTVNKGSGAAAGVNLYPTNVTFSGDYAVRFDMDVVEGDNVNYTTEGVMFGIDHTGIFTNWWSGSGITSGWGDSGTNTTWGSDGVWYWVSADGGAGAGDYLEKTGLGYTNYNTGWTNVNVALRATFANNFKDPAPYSTLNGTTPAPGLPANSSSFNAYALGAGYTNAWANVEIKSVKNLVTLSINKTTIFTFNNITVWTNGTLMLGYDDPFSSIGGADAAAYFSNIRVVRLASPVFTLQPTNIIVGLGTNATFAAAVSFDSSSSNTNGQWYLNGTAIAGATNYTYTVTVKTNSFGTYTFSVNDGNYTVTSSNAMLLPPAPSVVSVLPATRAGAPGGSASFTVTPFTYSGVTNYQWLSNSVPISGATAKTLTLSNLQQGNFGSLYTVRVNDGYTSVTSAPPVTITLASAQLITSPMYGAGKFALSFGTELGPNYVVEYKTNLLQSNWIPLSTNAGTGSAISVTNTASTNGQAFYRLLLQ